MPWPGFLVLAFVASFREEKELVFSIEWLSTNAAAAAAAAIHRFLDLKVVSVSGFPLNWLDKPQSYNEKLSQDAQDCSSGDI